MQARMGAPKAITAAAHKLARIFYRQRTSGAAYVDPGADADREKVPRTHGKQSEEKSLFSGV